MERGEDVVGCGGSEQDPTRNRYPADGEQQHAPHRIQTPPSHFRTIGGGPVLSHQRNALVRGARPFVPTAWRTHSCVPCLHSCEHLCTMTNTCSHECARRRQERVRP